MPELSRSILDTIYERYNRRDLVSPDPLQFLYAFPRKEDREIAALLASSLAYGRVSQILTSVSKVLEKTGASIAGYVMDGSDSRFLHDFRDFRHRFTSGIEVAGLLGGIKRILENHGSLEACFAAGMVHGRQSTPSLLGKFTERIRLTSPGDTGSLISDARKGSACKRLNLFLRWMVRSDGVDPGGWECITPSMLIVPLDTHMHYFGTCYGLTTRKAGDMKTALEITEGFARLNPEDPVKYDFALTRFGIRSDLCWDDLDALVCRDDGLI